MTTPKAYKRPESVLVVVHTPTSVLLLRRTDDAGFWQSVTGSLEWGENVLTAAVRELYEETGLSAEPAQFRDMGLVHRYPILPRWRARYSPDVSENTERAFALALPGETPVRLSAEHDEYAWFEFGDAAARVASWTNRATIRALDTAAR